MTVTTYRSTDTSAPTLTGTVGSLLAVLDACLVNGYGAKASAGWSKPFANSGNVGCYKNGTGGTGFCLSVNDNAPGAGGAKEARICGFETLSSVSTGSGQFPTTAQASIGLVVRKSTTADATVRNWTIVADSTCFYMFTETGDMNTPICCYSWMFGDFFSYSTTDTSNCMIIGRTIENSNATMTNNLSSANAYEGFPLTAVENTTLLSNAVTGHYAAANFTNIGGSIAVGKHADLFKAGIANIGWWRQLGRLGQMSVNSNETTFINAMAYPNPPDNGLYAVPLFIHHNGFIRGYLKGLWAPLQHLPLNHLDTFSGTGNLSGKSFMCINLITTWNSNGFGFEQGECFVETSSTWS